MSAADPALAANGLEIAIVTKEQLEAGVIESKGAARGFSIPEKTPLMGRRYILEGSNGPGKWVIKAALMEIFSPEIIPAPGV